MSLRLDTQFLPLLPTWFQEIREFQEICSTEQQEAEALAAAIGAVADNLFFQTMDTGSVQMWGTDPGDCPKPCR